MRKSLTILLLLFIYLATSLYVATQPPVKNEEGVQDVILELDELVFCPWSRSKSGLCDSKREIEVKAIAPNAENKGLEYYYLVSGGKIIGKGANVIWDFSGSKMGKYILGVGVGKDGIIQGKIVTKPFLFQACDVCDPPCECPSISVSGPTAPAKRGDSITFTLYVSGGTQNSVSYNWTVSSGKIVSGQGTNRIIVKTDKVKKVKIVTATVEVGGLCEGCPMRESASVELKDK